MAEPRKRNVRWGLLSLIFLLIAVVCILVSGSQGSYNALTLGGLFVGFLGAGYCSFKGLKGFSWLPR